MVKILSIFVAFLENMNFNIKFWNAGYEILTYLGQKNRRLADYIPLKAKS